MAVVVAGNNRIRDFPFNHPVALHAFYGFALESCAGDCDCLVDTRSSSVKATPRYISQWIDIGVTGRLVDKLSD